MTTIKNITLDGVDIEFISISARNLNIRNDSDGVIYVSKKPDVVAGADGTMSIPAGGSVLLADVWGKDVYFRGDGAVTVVGTDGFVSVFG